MPNSPLRLNEPIVYYAVGDIHGESKRLSELHQNILEHHHYFHSGKSRTIIHLGDYVDRGPDPCAVLEHLITFSKEAEASEGINIVNLRGNHEQQMLDAHADPDGSSMDTWMREGWGGRNTLQSYARRKDGDELLERHCEWIAQLPVIWRPKNDPFVFVHAGVDPDFFPNEDEQIYFWTRSSEFFDTSRWTSQSLKGQTVVHGHTPTKNQKAEISKFETSRRINVDAGAAYGGPLACAVIDPAVEEVRFLYA